MTDALIVQSGSSSSCKCYIVPVCVDNVDLTTEIARSEEKFLTAQNKYGNDPHYVENLFKNLYLNAPSHLTCREKCSLILRRLLLGPVAVPCMTETWDKNEYMNENPIGTVKGTLYVYKKCCKCHNGAAFNCTVLTDCASTHVFRGLLSTQRWEGDTAEHMICFCNKAAFGTDYTALILPAEHPITLDLYPQFLNILTRHLSVCEIDTLTNETIVELGPGLNHRICIHYKFLFNYGYISKRSFEFLPDVNKDIIVSEINKLFMSASYADVNFFLNKISEKLDADYERYVRYLTLDWWDCPILATGTLQDVRRITSLLNLNVTFGKGKAPNKGCLIFSGRFVEFADGDLIWRNLFAVYFDIMEGEGAAAAAAALVAADQRRRTTSLSSLTSPRENGICVENDGGAGGVGGEEDDRGGAAGDDGSVANGLSGPVVMVNATVGGVGVGVLSGGMGRASWNGTTNKVLVSNSLKYHVTLQRLMKNKLTGGDGRYEIPENRFVSENWPRPVTRLTPDEFNEIETVRDGDLYVNAFNTNRVINIRAMVRTAKKYENRGVFCPPCLTYNFVTDKYIFKEPACTVSTFGASSNQLQSLNINMKGSYVEFLYMLNVYRFHTNTCKFLLPAAVCNSNSSVDIHGLFNQEVMRSDRPTTFWTTNFPCMISNVDKVNMGWFKAATAIIPKVNGERLRSVLSKELAFLKTCTESNFDPFVHNLFVKLELRNVCPIPLLSKQLVLSLYMCMCVCASRDVSRIQRNLMTLVSGGAFDYSKNMIAHTKIKHICATAGSRVCNNVPKILHNKKKIKLDSIGRNANLLTYFSQLDANELTKRQLATVLKILIFYSRSIKNTGEVALVRRISKKYFGSRLCRKLLGGQYRDDESPALPFQGLREIGQGAQSQYAGRWPKIYAHPVHPTQMRWCAPAALGPPFRGGGGGISATAAAVAGAAAVPFPFSGGNAAEKAQSEDPGTAATATTTTAAAATSTATLLAARESGLEERGALDQQHGVPDICV
ncbi:protein U58 [Proboscivirus elephantidbeta4]|uniref:Protein U58 n=1 Tax=Elephant endotheliotropic herpesvirus 4 TaxID=548914 RepID=A0A0S1TPT1_9BETA|nr:protein U58 [Elephant endotheliotropic herpesvirus 4]ALM26008.1 protein U58 [Elephant endotheliotropic herpesvirus 4]